MAALIPAVKRPYLYLPDGWDTVWRAAKAASASTPCWVTAVGDSITAGVGATNSLTGSWFALLRAALITQSSQYADWYYAGQTASSWYNGSGNNGTAPVLPWVWSGNYTQYASLGIPLAPRATVDTSAVGTFTTPYACTSMDILYPDVGSAGTFSYAVDGGSATNVVLGSTGQVKRTALTGLANTTHTVVIAVVSSLPYLPCGIVTYKGSTGIGFANCGQGYAGTWNTHLGNGNAGPDNATRIWQGPTGNTGGKTSGTGFGFPTQPHLTIIGMGINDCGRTSTNTQFFAQPAQYEWLWKRTIQALRTGRANCSILLWSPSNPDPNFADLAAGWNGDQWHYYKAAQRRLAEEMRCAYLDIDARWGSTPYGQGFATATNNGHPTDAGHADIAAALQGVL